MKGSENKEVKGIKISPEIDYSDMDQTKDLTITPPVEHSIKVPPNIFSHHKRKSVRKKTRKSRNTVGTSIVINPVKENNLKSINTTLEGSKQVENYMNLPGNENKLVNSASEFRSSIVGEDLPDEEEKEKNKGKKALESEFNKNTGTRDSLAAPSLEPPQRKKSKKWFNVPEEVKFADLSNEEEANMQKLVTYVKDSSEAKEYFEHLSKKEEPKSPDVVKVSLQIPNKKDRHSSFFLDARRGTNQQSYGDSRYGKVSYCNRIKNSCSCCFKPLKKKRSAIRLSNLAQIIPVGTSNRFGHLEGEEKSEVIREFWRSAIRKVGFMRKTIDIFKIMNKDTQEKLTNAKIEDRSKYLLMPSSRFRICWDMISIVLLLYISIMTPFLVSYLDDIPQAFTHLETVVSILFFADIILNFFTPYLSHNILITSHKQIAKNYLKTWFILDVIASMPFHLIITNDDGDRRWTVIPRMLTMLKLFKLGRLLQFIQLFMDKVALRYKIKPDSSRRMSYLFSVLFVVHIFTCAWYLQARLNQFSPETWVMRYGFYDHGIFYKYFLSCFWVCQTLTTVVYGDYQPNTFYERFLCFILMIFGVAFYSTLFSNMSEKEKDLRYKILTLANLASKTKLPPELMAKIRRNIEIKYDTEDGTQMVLYGQLLEGLNSGLRAELIKCMYRNLIRKIRFFNDKPPEFLWKIIPKLKRLLCNEGELIYKPGDHANEVYFVKSGVVLLETRSGKQITSFAQGSYFGDTEVISSQLQGNTCERTTYARSQENLELLALDKQLFFNTLGEYPVVEEDVFTTHKIRELRQRQVNEGFFHDSYLNPITEITERSPRVIESKQSQFKNYGEESSSEETGSSYTSSSPYESSNLEESAKDLESKSSRMESSFEGKERKTDKIASDSQISKQGIMENLGGASDVSYKTLSVPKSGPVPEQENAQVAREANLNNSRCSSQGKGTNIRNTSSSQKEEEEFHTPRLLEDELKIVVPVPITITPINQNINQPNYNYDDSLELKINSNPKYFHAERVLSTESEVIVMESPKDIEIIPPPKIEQIKPIIITEIRDPALDSFGSRVQNFIQKTKYKENNIENEFLKTEREEINTHRPLMEEGVSDSVKSMQKASNKKRAQGKLEKKSSTLKRSLGKGRSGKKLIRNESKGNNEISPQTDKVANNPAYLFRTKKRSTLKIGASPHNNHPMMRSMRNLFNLHQSPSAKDIMNLTPSNSHRNADLTPSRKQNLDLPPTRMQNVNSNKNQIMITINLNSQNKTTRVFVKELKTDLIRIVESIFSALLDRIEESQALIRMGINL